MTRDCACPKARHEHGTYLAYVRDRCRCDECREANTAHSRTRARAQLYGRYDGLVDAEPVRAHIRMLSAHGVGLKQVSRRSGVGGGVLTKLVYGHPTPNGDRRPPSRRCTPRVRDRILAVTPDDLAPAALADATGTRRRLQALVVIGWSQCKLAARLGMARANFGKVITSDRVTVTTRRAVAVLYDQLWDQQPPHAQHREKIAYSRALRHAREHGWHPPLAWDDDSIDEPAAEPFRATYIPAADRGVDWIAVEEACLGRRVPLTSEERAAAVERLTRAGKSAKQAAAILGASGRTVVRRRRENQRKVAA